MQKLLTFFTPNYFNAIQAYNKNDDYLRNHILAHDVLTRFLVNFLQIIRYCKPYFYYSTSRTNTELIVQ